MHPTFSAVVRTALVAVLGLTVLSSTPTAHAAAGRGACTGTATRITRASVSPSVAVVGIRHQRPVRLTVTVADPCRTLAVRAGVHGNEVASDPVPLTRTRTVAASSTWDLAMTVDPTYLRNSDAGRWSTRLHAAGSTRTERPGPGFRIVRASRLTVDATTERPRRGASLQVLGHLTRADWDAGRYATHRGQSVTLQFRTMAGRYADVTTARSDDRGRVTRTVKATVDGCYRWAYSGTATTGRVTTKGDCIDVR